MELIHSFKTLVHTLTTHGTISQKMATFTFTGKPGIIVGLEDPRNPLEYFTSVDVIARETNRYVHKFLENMSHLKLRPRVHYWKEINRNEIMKLLAFFLLQGFTRNRITKAVFVGRKFWKHPYFRTCSARGLTFYTGFFTLFTT
jgi:hypothetical protein